MTMTSRSRRPASAGAAPLPPQRKWRAILLSTLVLVPAYWSLLVGLVSGASSDADAPAAAPFIAFGLAVIPFVFVALAFLSEHPRAPGAVVKAMILTLLVGIPVSALAADGVTGMVAGIGAGGIVALRADEAETWKARALAVAVTAAYVFLTVRIAGDVVLIVAPALPLSAIGVADHLSERRKERQARGA
jgi:hypothetical protein